MLRQIVSYDPATGFFVRLALARGKGKVGARAGWLGGHGYWYLNIAGYTYTAHRLAFLYMTGEWPPNDSDHANGDRADNRWKNLRLATRAQNMRNSKRKKKSGWKGVTRQPGSAKWLSVIMFNRQVIRLGSFYCPVAAHLAYALASAKYHGEFGRIS